MGYVSIPVDLTKYSKINSGNYTGNTTANRAIAHGLGCVPKIISLTIDNNVSAVFRIIDGDVIHANDAATNNANAITGWDATNFYVGNVTSYDYTANATGVVYNWVAFS